MRSDRGHTQTIIEYQNQKASVDVGIADLILSLWQLGFITYDSCQGAKKSATSKNQLMYVDMPEDDAKKFLQIVGYTSPRTGSKGYDQVFPRTLSSLRPHWYLLARFFDSNDAEGRHRGRPSKSYSDARDRGYHFPKVKLEISVFFPKSDYALVLSKLASFGQEPKHIQEKILKS